MTPVESKLFSIMECWTEFLFNDSQILLNSRGISLIFSDKEKVENLSPKKNDLAIFNSLKTIFTPLFYSFKKSILETSKIDKFIFERSKGF